MTENTYPKPAGGAPDLPALELEVLDYWARDDTFRASITNRADAAEYVFYDGPPFANGLPHYGHLLTGYVKDIVPRYQTMRGCKVERRFGWDTHGLPAELEASASSASPTRHEIDEMGVDAFNDACRESVLRYTDEWRDYVTRQARWVDFDNDYKTLDLTYMESVLWAFKQLYDKGLAYEGYRVLPYCWNDETPLSNHELRMDDDVYQIRQDPASPSDSASPTAMQEIWPARICWCGRRRRGRCRPTWPSPSTRTSTTSRCTAPTAPRYVLAERPVGSLRTGTRRRRRRVLGDVSRQRPASACVTDRRSLTSWPPPTPFTSSPPTSSPPRTAPASSTWPRPTVRTTRSTADTAGIVPVTPVGRRGRFDATVPDYQASMSSTPTRRSSRSEEPDRARRPRTARC